MSLIAGEENKGEDKLLTAELTVSSPTIVPAITTSSPPVTSSTAISSSSTAAMSSGDDTQGKRKSNGKYAVKNRCYQHFSNGKWTARYWL